MGRNSVCYFRWRQAPFAQEQMHAGLLRPDSSEAEAAPEVRDAAQIIEGLGPQQTVRAPVAILFSYEAAWTCAIQPQGQTFRYLELVYGWYSAARRLGLDVDIVAPGTGLSGYAMVLVPTLPIVSAPFVEDLSAATNCKVPTLIGPRSGSKTASFQIPEKLAPGELRQFFDLTVSRVESLREGAEARGDGWTMPRWLEHVETSLDPEFALLDGRGVVFKQGVNRYCAGWPDRALLRTLIERMAREAGVDTIDLPEGLRTRRTASHLFAFNYSSEPVHFDLTGEVIDPAGVSITAINP